MSRCGDCRYFTECLKECKGLDADEQFAEVGGCRRFEKKTKFWATVSVHFDYYTEIEADTLEEAESKAYDEAKELMGTHDPKLRPFGIRVVAVGKVNENGTA